MISKKIELFLNHLKNKVFTKDLNCKIFLGYSAGPDSTALLKILSSISYLKDKIYAIHVNHGISENRFKWEEISLRTCEKLNIPLKIIRVDIKNSPLYDRGILASCRFERYKAIFDFISSNEFKGYDKFYLTAHHVDDLIETYLMRIFKGYDISKCIGFGYNFDDSEFSLNLHYPDVKILRPFLDYVFNHDPKITLDDVIISKDDLLEYCLYDKNVEFVIDEENLDEYFDRNFIRHKIMKDLSKKYTSIRRTLVYNILSLYDDLYIKNNNISFDKYVEYLNIKYKYFDIDGFLRSISLSKNDLIKNNSLFRELCRIIQNLVKLITFNNDSISRSNSHNLVYQILKNYSKSDSSVKIFTSKLIIRYDAKKKLLYFYDKNSMKEASDD